MTKLAVHESDVQKFLERAVVGCNRDEEHGNCTLAYQWRLFITGAFAGLTPYASIISRLSAAMAAANRRDNRKKKSVFVYGAMAFDKVLEIANGDSYVELHDIVKLELLLIKILEANEHGVLPVIPKHPFTATVEIAIRDAVSATQQPCVYPSFHYVSRTDLSRTATTLSHPTVNALALAILAVPPPAPLVANANTFVALSTGPDATRDYKFADRLATYLVDRINTLSGGVAGALDGWVRNPTSGPNGDGNLTIGLPKRLGNHP